MITTSFIYFFFFYLIRILFFLTRGRVLIYWVFIEINLINFILILSFFSSKFDLKKEVSFYYFLIQSLGSLIFLFSSSIFDSLNLDLDILVLLALRLKLAIFPLFSWFFFLRSSLRSIIFILIITFQKIPIFLILFNFSTNYLSLFLLFSFISGSILIFFRSNVFALLIRSSISRSFWIYLIFLEDNKIFFLFFLFYTLTIFFFFGEESSIHNLILFCFLCGLPPFSLFFFKFFLVNFLRFNFFFLFFFILFRFVRLIGYTKFFFFNFFSEKIPYWKHEILFKIKLYIGITFFFCFPLLIQSQCKLY